MRYAKILSLLLLICILMSNFVGCIKKKGNGVTEDTTTTEDTETDIPAETDSVNIKTEPAEGDTVYNIIFALATIPPVLSALDCIENGYETYVIIERGKTYNGIESVKTFHNAGFDPANNQSTGFNDLEFQKMTECVKSLKSTRDNVFFSFYAQDGTALKCAAVAANAGLALDEFHITMCEDGSGAYVSLRNNYTNDMFVDENVDTAYINYMEWYIDAKERFERVMSKNDNKNDDEDLGYHIGRAFALASLPNFTYYLQDNNAVKNTLLSIEGGGETKLLSAFGFEGYKAITETKLNLRFGTISEAIDRLTDEKKQSYLTLMYGSYFEDTYNALTRITADGEKVSDNKLVFIGSRHSLYPKFASDEKYGIGGLTENDTVPKSYAELPDRFKNILLFSSDADYKVFLDVINNPSNFAIGIIKEAQRLSEVAVFNLYIDYMFTLKLTYLTYCSSGEYDMIMKGHPREALGFAGEWGNRYKVELSNGSEYVYDFLLDKALSAFHTSDSIGRLIGTVPYGTAAENLAYLGANITFGGLPSSTYSGVDTDIPIRFIVAETDESILGDMSQVKDRVTDGTLIYTQSDGKKVTADYINVGNMLKTAKTVYEKNGDDANATKYNDLFTRWIADTHEGKTDIDAQGIAK